ARVRVAVLRARPGAACLLPAQYMRAGAYRARADYGALFVNVVSNGAGDAGRRGQCCEKRAAVRPIRPGNGAARVVTDNVSESVTGIGVDVRQVVRAAATTRHPDAAVVL